MPEILDPSDPLWPIRAKITRADQHIEVLAQEVGGFINSGPYTPVHELDSEAGEYVWRVVVRQDPDPGLAINISEAIHHIHSALDNTAWAVATAHSGEPPKGTGFPVYGHVNAYRTSWSRQGGYFQTRGMPTHAQAIIEDVQPYHRRNAYQADLLWMLRELSNTNKHQALFLLGGSSGRGNVTVTQEGGEVAVQPVKFINGPFKNGDVIARWPLPPAGTEGMEMKLNVNFAFHVALAQPGPASGREVMQFIVDLRNAANQVVERLAPFMRP